MAIHRLPEELSRKIAAGEVIERPLSVAKELIENSLDAGARNVEVELVQGGKVLISVKDDGCGIAPDDLPLAVEKHATSKIASESDLDAIVTLGYRGEALSSIGTVSRFEMYSRQADLPEGAVLRLENGAAKVTPLPLRPGTTVVVKDLFYNLPARRKFLKSAAAEFRRILRLVQDYAYAYPAVAFSLVHGGKTVFKSSGSGSVLNLLAATWGDEPPVTQARFEAGRRACALWRQDLGPQSRFQLISFVNGRRVSDAVIRSALTGFHWAARGNWLAMLSLPPEDVDVNVHPAKTEILFRHSGEVYDLVRRAAEQFAREYSPLPSLTRGAGQSGDVGTLDFSKTPANSVPASWRPAGSDNRLFTRVELPVFRAASPQAFPVPVEAARRSIAHLPFPAEQRHDEPATEENGVVYMGQISQGYLIFAVADGLLIVDPHAAHERVNYERICTACARPGGEERLVMPVSLPPTLREEVMAHRGELSELRFSIDDDGSLSGLPMQAKAAGLSPIEMLRSALKAIEEQGEEKRQPLLDAFAAAACRASVKLTTRLSPDEARTLLDQLNACAEPSSCPHGRPTVLRLSGASLDKHFGRLGL